jgi:hypothetical protein
MITLSDAGDTKTERWSLYGELNGVMALEI